MNRAFQIKLFLCVCACATTLFAETPANKVHDKEIIRIIQQASSRAPSDRLARLRLISQHFISRPYQLGPLGEGKDGHFDQHPLYRTDVFDCLTYVETVLALACSDSLTQFQKNIIKLRYRDGHVSYKNRNHFTSVDWNINNAHQGIVQDISYRILDKSQQPIAKIANTVIDKPNWYRHKKLSDLCCSKQSNSQQKNKKILAAWRALAKQVKPEKAVLLYIPISQIIRSDGSVNAYVLSQLPDVAIIEIVRPNWALKDAIGTNLHVSHVGLSFRTKQGLIFRHASSQHKKVIQLKLSDYLRAFTHSKTVKGINVHAISNKRFT